MWQLARDTIGQDDLDALAEWLRTGPRLTQGELVRRFEQEWSAWLGVEESIMVGSGSVANFALVAVAAGRIRGRPPRVGVSAVTWSTNVSPSMLLGHEVVVFDVSPETLGVDEEQVVAALDEGRIDILFVTHLLGLDALTDHVLEAVHRNGVILLEDCCEAHGTRHGAAKVGTFGLGSTFSFYFGHHLSTIEGGMVSTNDPDVADEVRLMRAHGLARESSRFDRLSGANPDIDPRFLFVSAGLNFRSTEVNAFLGSRQLLGLDERIGHRNANMARFMEEVPPWLWREYRLDGMSSFALPVIARDQEGTARVRETIGRLGIESRPVVAGNLLRQPFVQGHDVAPYRETTPVADHVHDHGIYVGNGHHVTVGMAETLAHALGGDTT